MRFSPKTSRRRPGGQSTGMAEAPEVGRRIGRFTPWRTVTAKWNAVNGRTRVLVPDSPGMGAASRYLRPRASDVANQMSSAALSPGDQTGITLSVTKHDERHSGAWFSFGCLLLLIR
jgi:hypothetical protein